MMGFVGSSPSMMRRRFTSKGQALSLPLPATANHVEEQIRASLEPNGKSRRQIDGGMTRKDLWSQAFKASTTAAAFAFMTVATASADGARAAEVSYASEALPMYLSSDISVFVCIHIPSSRQQQMDLRNG